MRVVALRFALCLAFVTALSSCGGGSDTERDVITIPAVDTGLRSVADGGTPPDTAWTAEDDAGGADTGVGTGSDTGAMSADTFASTDAVSDAGAADTGWMDTGRADTGNDAGRQDTDTGLSDGGQRDTGGPALYRSSGDPYQNGPLAVSRTTISAGASGSPVDLLVFSPSMSGRYGVVVFQHGFSLRNSYYTTVLKHLASHGFVVVAPQMYAPSPFGAPSSAEEATKARALYTWLPGGLPGAVPGTPIFGRLGLAGHSRGGKVVWSVLEDGYGGARAVATVDPVDGGSGFGGSATMVTDGGLSPALPSLTVGTGLGPKRKFGMACAPANRNHQLFYGAVKSPAVHVVVPKYGHMDMLDASTPGCSLVCSACVDGPSDGKMRTTTAGLLTAFFRHRLQGDGGARTVLLDAMAPPAAVTVNSK